MSEGETVEGSEQGSAADAGDAEAPPLRRAPRARRQVRSARALEDMRAVNHEDPRIRKAMDGFGNPLRVTGPPGWDYYWVTDEDLATRNRPWTQCLWGVDKVKIAGLTGANIAAKTPIKFRELSLYKMRSEDSEEIRENDPNRVFHNLMWERSQEVSETGYTLRQGRDGFAPANAGRRGVHPDSDGPLGFVSHDYDPSARRSPNVIQE